MSADEMREYCLSLCSYKLRVEVRLKNGREIIFGKITEVESDRFQLTGDNDDVQQLRFAWIARIKNA